VTVKLTDAQRQQFDASGFLILRGLLAADEAKTYFGELEALLRASFGQPYTGQAAHWVPATDRYTPCATNLLADERFRAIAVELLGRPVLGEGTDGSFYVGDTPWHHDSVHPELVEAVKFTLYGDPIDGDSGALRLIPGSHRAAPLSPGACSHVVFDTRPGDAVVFDVRVWHGAFNGGCRVAGSINYRIDPATDREIEACRAYFARTHHHVGYRYGTGVKLYPEYWRSLSHPAHRHWVERMTELGVIDPRSASTERDAITKREVPAKHEVSR
jgi:hypothetical protein